MGCPLCDRLGGLRAGTDPAGILELAECFAVLGDNQGCPGWCVLILKDHVEHLDELPVERQARVFTDAAQVAAAIRAVFPRSGRAGGPPRINYECLGNVVAHVHWHIIPRHADDPTPTTPVWSWPPDQLRGAMPDPQRSALAARLREALRAL